MACLSGVPALHLRSLGDLPILNLANGPARHPDCCLSLSSKLLTILADVFPRSSPPSSTLLSVGSGSGLLEALLLDHAQHTLNVEGVEVHQQDDTQVNRYLPEPCYHTVRGTWDLSPRLRDADVCGLMFVYPRQVDLVRRYVEAASSLPAQHVRHIVWLGPQADWADFKVAFAGVRDSNLKILSGEEGGLEEFEMMAILQRSGD